MTIWYLELSNARHGKAAYWDLGSSQSLGSVSATLHPGVGRVEASTGVDFMQLCPTLPRHIINICTVYIYIYIVFCFETSFVDSSKSLQVLSRSTSRIPGQLKEVWPPLQLVLQAYPQCDVFGWLDCIDSSATLIRSSKFIYIPRFLCLPPVESQGFMWLHY